MTIRQRLILLGMSPFIMIWVAMLILIAVFGVEVDIELFKDLPFQKRR